MRGVNFDAVESSFDKISSGQNIIFLDLPNFFQRHFLSDGYTVGVLQAGSGRGPERNPTSSPQHISVPNIYSSMPELSDSFCPVFVDHRSKELETRNGALVVGLHVHTQPELR